MSVAVPTASAELRRIEAASELCGFRLIGHHDLGGNGDGFQVKKHGDLVYVGHSGTSSAAMSILDCSDPSAPELVRQLPRRRGTRQHKVQIVGDVLVQNLELVPHEDDVKPRTGMLTFDISDPTDPREMGFYETGGMGAHKIWFTELPYAHLGGSIPGIEWSGYPGVDWWGYHIVDLSDPATPTRVGTWWVPGALPDDSDPWTHLEIPGGGFIRVVHAVIPSGDYAYAACMDSGMAVLDISDPTSPRAIGRVCWTPPYGGGVHTCLPLPDRGLVVVACEAHEPTTYDDWRIWMVDVREPRQPVPIATFPITATLGGPPYNERPGRFGPHNVHENQPGAFQSDQIIFSTFFNAGVRVHDISDPSHPTEIGWFVPPAPARQEAIMLNDIYVDPQQHVYVTDRVTGGLYILDFSG